MALYRCGMGGGFRMTPTVLATVDAGNSTNGMTVNLNDSINNYKAIAVVADGLQGVFSKFGTGYIIFPTSTGNAPSCMAIMSTAYIKTLLDYDVITSSTTNGISEDYLEMKYINETTINLRNKNPMGAYFTTTKIIGLN